MSHLRTTRLVRIPHYVRTLDASAGRYLDDAVQVSIAPSSQVDQVWLRPSNASEPMLIGVGAPYPAGAWKGPWIIGGETPSNDAAAGNHLTAPRFGTFSGVLPGTYDWRYSPVLPLGRWTWVAGPSQVSITQDPAGPSLDLIFHDRPIVANDTRRPNAVGACLAIGGGVGGVMASIPFALICTMGRRRASMLAYNAGAGPVTIELTGLKRGSSAGQFFSEQKALLAPVVVAAGTGLGITVDADIYDFVGVVMSATNPIVDLDWEVAD